MWQYVESNDENNTSSQVLEVGSHCYVWELQHFLQQP